MSAGNLVAAIQRIMITTPPHDMARRNILHNVNFQNLVLQIEHLLHHHTFLEQVFLSILEQVFCLIVDLTQYLYESM